MANEEVIERVKQLKKKAKRVKAVVIRENSRYIVYIMVSLSGGRGLGFVGPRTAFGVAFKSKASAETLKSRINRLK